MTPNIKFLLPALSVLSLFIPPVDANANTASPANKANKTVVKVTTINDKQAKPVDVKIASMPVKVVKPAPNIPKKKIASPKPVAAKPVNKPVDFVVKNGEIKSPLYAESHVLNFDISGVKLLMSPNEARSALYRNGYQTYDLMGGLDWKNALASEVIKRSDASKSLNYDSSKIISAIEATHINGERIRVEFMPYADNLEGVAVVSIAYVPNDSLEERILEQKIIGKFGEPTNSGNSINNMSWTWYRLLPTETIDKSPYLGWRRYDRTLLLSFKDEYKNRLQKRLDVEIAKQQVLKTVTHF